MEYHGILHPGAYCHPDQLLGLLDFPNDVGEIAIVRRNSSCAQAQRHTPAQTLTVPITNTDASSFLVVVGWQPSGIYAPTNDSLAEHLIHIAPTNGLDEDIDVAGRIGTEIDVIRMFVHIEREDRDTSDHGAAMIGRP